MTHPTEIDTTPMHHDDAIAPTSKVTLGLLWSILGATGAVLVFLWARFDGLDEKFVGKDLFNARMVALEKQIDRLEDVIERQANR